MNEKSNEGTLKISAVTTH